MSANLQALNHCKLSLSALLRTPQHYDAFLQAYRNTIVFITEEGKQQSIDDSTSQQDHEEILDLWSHHIYPLCLHILSNSLSLIYESNTDILKTLDSYLATAHEKPQKAENCILLLNYLCLNENIKKLRETTSQDELLLNVISAAIEIVNQDMHLKSSNLFKHHGHHEHMNAQLVAACHKFLRMSTEEAISKYCNKDDEGKKE